MKLDTISKIKFQCQYKGWGGTAGKALSQTFGHRGQHQEVL